MLAGRKTDVEFQGQQINQERTTLATQSSAYNTQLLNLKVPTPPSSSEYTTVSYSAAINGITANILLNSIKAEEGGTYALSYTKSVIGTAGAESTKDNIYTKHRDADKNIWYTASVNGADVTLAQVTDSNTQKTICDGVGLQKDAGGEYPILFLYTAGDGTVKYVTQGDLDNFAAKNYEEIPDDPATPLNDAIPVLNTVGEAIQSYWINPAAQTTETVDLSGVVITWSDSNRISSLTFGGKTYTVSTNSASDQAAYDDAYNEYVYGKAVYDQEMNNINSKIAIVEAQDKKLQLKLTDLDTQQQALSTEMDSVKKVVDKNIEQSFKAFA
jgi:hypothetical protein